ncbi:MAG TPA: hypothetical protein VJM83_06420 [Nitrospirota bacterium]|nr:hypothetical protein [Nitrospirota bacterium]
MKFKAAFVFSFLVFLQATAAFPETFDASRDYTCDRVSAGVWYYEGYRASDGQYLSMVFEHAPIRELSKYGADTHFLPDGDQPYYPFITRFSDNIVMSPATTGRRFDAVLTWAAPYDCEADISGVARLMGNIRGEAEGKKVALMIKHNEEKVWSGELGGPETKEFGLARKLSAGDRLRLHVVNAGDGSGNLTSLNVRVETKKK